MPAANRKARQRTPTQGEGESGQGGGRRQETEPRKPESASPNSSKEQTRASQHTLTNRETSLSTPGGAMQAFRARLCPNLLPGGEGTQSRVKTMPDDSLRSLWGLPENQCARETAPPVMSVRSQVAQIHGLRVTYGPSELSFGHTEQPSW